MRRAAASLVLFAAVCSGCGAFKPWAAHATRAQKPASPLKAPADKAVLVVVVTNPQGSGNGSYSVLEGDGLVAQIPEDLAAWTAREMTPGEHQFYVRTWTSDFCVRRDAHFAAGKVYVLNLNPANTDRTGLVGSNGNIFPVGRFERPGSYDPAGSLAFLPYVAMDEAGAAKELADRASQAASCREHADAMAREMAQRDPASTAAHDAGFEEIDFTVPAK